MADEKTLFNKGADFLVSNGYKVDDEGTRELHSKSHAAKGTETKIYKDEKGNLAYLESDNKGYVALNKAYRNPVSGELVVGKGGRVNEADKKTPEQLRERLNLISKDQGIALASAAPQKAKVTM